MRRFIGFFLVVLGGIMIAEQLKLLGDVKLWDFLWPAFLIFLGVSSLVKHGTLRIISTTLILIGGFYLLKAFKIEWFADKDLPFFALILALFGLSLIFGKRRRPYVIVPSGVHVTSTNQREFTSVMGGLDEKVINPDFKGCEITAVMGSAEVDLSEIVLQQDSADIEITAIMGGVEVTLPRGYRLDISGTPIMGGYECTNPGDPTSPKTLRVRYTSVMGGIEIR